MGPTLEALKRWISSMEQCSEGKGNPNHAGDLEEHGICHGCGETKAIIFRKKEYGVLLRDEDGIVVAGLKGFAGSAIEILDYPEAKRLSSLSE